MNSVSEQVYHLCVLSMCFQWRLILSLQWGQVIVFIPVWAALKYLFISPFQVNILQQRGHFKCLLPETLDLGFKWLPSNFWLVTCWSFGVLGRKCLSLKICWAIFWPFSVFWMLRSTAWFGHCSGVWLLVIGALDIWGAFIFPVNRRKSYNTVNIGFCDQPLSGGLRSLKLARPLKQEFGYSDHDQVVVKARVWV